MAHILIVAFEDGLESALLDSEREVEARAGIPARLISREHVDEVCLFLAVQVIVIVASIVRGAIVIGIAEAPHLDEK